MSSATATGMRCIAEKNINWQPATGINPNARSERQCRRRNDRSRAIARTSAGDRMRPASPMRTRSAADSDQPASRSGLTSGPLDEKASAETTAMTMPPVR